MSGRLGARRMHSPREVEAATRGRPFRKPEERRLRGALRVLGALNAGLHDKLIRKRLFSIAHNALTNAFRHARASRVEVVLGFAAHQIELSISDDGGGLPDGYAERGHGFPGMQADAERLGGALIVESGGREQGTTVTCRVPYGNQE